MSLHRPLTTLLLVLSFVPLACGEDEVRRSSITVKQIAADSGGTVTYQGLQLQIPPKALKENTIVWLTVAPISEFPELADAQSEVLVIEPEGIVLQQPATVTLAVPTAKVIVSQLIGDDLEVPRHWQNIEILSGTESSVMVSITHFAPLAVVVPQVEVTRYTIKGKVVWGSGSQPATSAPVQLLQGGEQLDETTSDDKGEFSFSNLAKGDYTLKIEYECLAEKNVTIDGSTPVDVTVTLCG